MNAWKLPAVAVLRGGEVVGVVREEEPDLLSEGPVCSADTSLETARTNLAGFPALAVERSGPFAALLTPADLAPPAASDLAAQIWNALGEADRDLLTCLSAALPLGRLALVGGAVRDALLGLPPLDLDIVVVGGDVEEVAQKSGLPFVFHPAYRNATLSLPGTPGRAADLVSARLERYPAPGASPLPHPGTLAQDLLRRDFSLNALALVVGESGPELHDPAGGLDDLARRELRPLHATSFTDDASRLVRGARLAARLSLQASPALLAQVPQALAVAAQTPRLDAELRLLLSEPRPGQAAQTLIDWGAGALLPLPAVKVLLALDRLSQRPAETVYAAGLLSGVSDAAAWEQRLALGSRPAALLSRALADGYAAPGSAEAMLRGVLRPEAYVPLTGRDVLKLGAAPGPGVGAALAYLAERRRLGEFGSRAEEEAALRAYLERS
ncbi:CCA tRNA nucleotidyltransferase [Deinococcus irradiatisoli]|uniref:CCA tRNA nucleotidyltransferase n=2 Tax=Deinococcus irradiatisoli TaxID=2202254 RepID=A0A2Z3JHF0_9DEIO|nr:CCA tRNA nucleotidyltransferase [Deinococcus irradiatisoli]